MAFTELFLGAVAIAGILIIFDFHPQYKTGIILGMLSAVSCALFPIFNKQFIRQYPTGSITLYEMTGGFIALSVFLPFYSLAVPSKYYLPTAADVAWLLVLSILCTVYCFHLQLNALKKISAFTANLSYNLEPIYGIILAFIFFKENKSLNGHFYTGVGLIILAVLLQTIRVWRKNNLKYATV